MRINESNGHEFLAQLASFPSRTFENRFSGISSRLGLGHRLQSDELLLLYRAAFRAALCNIAVNGEGGCGGQIRPEQEGNRVRLEKEFMAARDAFFATSAWQSMPARERKSVCRVFLTVTVADNNLAW